MKTKSMIKTTVAALSFAFLLSGTVRAADAKENWSKHCAKCHGLDGKGQTKMGRQSGVKDYTDSKVQAELKDENAIKIIKEGLMEKDKKKMDAYGEKLSADEIKALVAFIRDFKK